MLSHLEENVIDNYRSNQKKSGKICHVLRKKCNNSDNALQIKPTF